jgi:PIN domain nuclease of toxin-antitoxin system
MADNPAKLSAHARDVLLNTGNEIFLSVASFWEARIKINIGRLISSKPLEELVEHQVRINQLYLLPVHANIIYALDHLPDLHKDPFDRLLLAQSIVENMPLLSADTRLAAYPATVVW